MKRIDNKWALVTGSSRGIGQQIALGLAERGCNIILHGREPQNLAATLDKLQAFNVNTHIAAGELSSPWVFGGNSPWKINQKQNITPPKSAHFKYFLIFLNSIST